MQAVFIRHKPSTTDEILEDPGSAFPDLDPAADEVILYGAGGRDPELCEVALALETAGFIRVGLYSGGLADWRESGRELE